MSMHYQSEEEFACALDCNICTLTRGNQVRKKQSLFYFFGEQSGAGNTAIHRIKIKELQGNIIIIDGDSFRAQHPYYLDFQQTYAKESVECTK